jgi:hypothetical protein
MDNNNSDEEHFEEWLREMQEQPAPEQMVRNLLNTMVENNIYLEETEENQALAQILLAHAGVTEGTNRANYSSFMPSSLWLTA